VGGLFGQADFSPSKVCDSNPLEEQLATLKELVDSGKVRYIGVSNETPYGVMEMLHLSRTEPEKYAHIVSIQNSYSMTVRKDYEAALAEVCYMNHVALLPYSPLAGGVLTGKYENPKTVPENARLKLFPGFMERYLGSQNQDAVREYCDIARRSNMTPTQMALSWVYHREHVCSTIIGATSQDQLHECLKSYDIRLEEDVMGQINNTYKKYTDPTKAY
jgi:aryl-alcohol dehydrogenase-like predicted oxidoreductase